MKRDYHLIILNKDMESYNNTSTRKRTVYFDYLRVAATFAIIALHVSSSKWHSVDVNGFEWQVFNFCDSIVRWGVPIFVMISGSLFLNREIPQKVVYSKYILRLIISFITWSAIYALFVNGDMLTRIEAILYGHFHMWFILMIVGLYMCLPFIKPIVENDLRIKYFLVLSFIFAFVLPESISLANDFGNELIIREAGKISGMIDSMSMHTVLGYVGFFVFGFYLNKMELDKGQRICIYLLGILGFAFTIIVDLIVTLKTQTPCQTYYRNFNVNIIFEAAAVFTWFKHRKYNNVKINAIMQKMSKYSFGAYLVHALIMEQLNIRLGLNTLSFDPVISVPVISMIIITLSFTISAILNQIPVLKKYIV